MDKLTTRSPGGQPCNNNATRHSLTSHRIFEQENTLLKGYIARFTQDYDPVCAIEEVLVKRMARLAVQLERAGEIDFEAFAKCFVAHDSDVEGRTYVSWDALAFKALVDTITRYEMQIGRGLIKTKHELERTIASRKGEMVPAPIPVDFTW